MKYIRNKFPMLKKIIYLDNAALVMKPVSAIKASDDFYRKYSVSSRTDNSEIGIYNNLLMKRVKTKTAQLLNCNTNEIIFTSGTTDSLNKIALMMQDIVKKNDEILIHAFNHASNMTPWIDLANICKAKVVITDDILNKISNKTKIIALAQETNNMNIKQEIEEIYKKAKEINAYVINDAAQAIIYQKVTFENCDVIAFSTNKLYGPTGFGVLAIKNNLLNKLKPKYTGGGTIKNVDGNNCNYTLNKNNLFEAGTPNLAAYHMFDKSLDFVNELDYKEVQKKLDNLSIYAYKKLSQIRDIKLYNDKKSHIIMFNIGRYNPQDIAHYLATQNIYVRSGIFCAHYLQKITNETSFVRVSLAIYNNKSDIDKLVEALKNGGDFLVL
ncbi:aminotransferase class V-fold PLP-dependent enzyme [Mycoplasmopsis lipofaciens]|uniref:aminotransferase class V-fold PLP-dependent enzyme n=1 Tax=Mycoplasmopsis lipofaciens TaxID=114884 RepID=UPI0004894CB5|nr:aminotransferase class V-fold PLP-dependent enzyme [Mycoplasmopsis lipofaciens]